MPLMLDVTAPKINQETTSKSKPLVSASGSTAESPPKITSKSLYLNESSQYLVPIKDSVSEIWDLIKVLKGNSETYRRAIGQLEVIMRKTDRIEAFIVKERKLGPAYHRADEALSFCSNQLRSLSAIMMATREQLTSDEETVISPAYISTKLDEAISTLSIANIGDTQLEQSTKRYNIFGGGITISGRYQNILSLRPPPSFKNIKPTHHIAVEREKILHQSTIITLRIHLPWREFPIHWSLHSSRTFAGIEYSILRYHHIVPYNDPSIKACQSGDLAELRHILASGGFCIDTTDPDGRSLLHVEFRSLKGSEHLLM